MKKKYTGTQVSSLIKYMYLHNYPQIIEVFSVNIFVSSSRATWFVVSILQLTLFVRLIMGIGHLDWMTGLPTFLILPIHLETHYLLLYMIPSHFRIIHNHRWLPIMLPWFHLGKYLIGESLISQMRCVYLNVKYYNYWALMPVVCRQFVCKLFRILVHCRCALKRPLLNSWFHFEWNPWSWAYSSAFLHEVAAWSTQNFYPHGYKLKIFTIISNHGPYLYVVYNYKSWIQQGAQHKISLLY